MESQRQTPLSSSNYYNINNLNPNITRTSPRSSPPSASPYPYTSQSQRSPQSPPEPLNLQTRRLRLRNARFQAPSITPAKVSDRFSASTWRSLSPNSDIVDKENYPSPSEQQRTPGSSRRRVSILQEIHDSSQRGRKPRRPSVSRLFGPPLDGNESSLNRRQPYRSPSFRRSSPYLIPEDSHAEPMMGTSYLQSRSSPLSSDALHKARIRSISRSRGTTNHATERYIEHLETQLAAAQMQLSPMQASTTQPQSSKLRSLSAEIKVLRQELSEWEDRFDVRVDEEVALRTDIESKLRTKIIFLEGQLEDYTTRVKELECERDLQAQKLRNVESLRSTNRSLERRIDVLTELLAQSPTKIDPRSPEASPTRSPGPRLSRPKSMLSSAPIRIDPVYQPLVDPTVLHEGPEDGKFSDSDVPDLIPDDSTVASKSQRSSTISHPSSVMSRWSVPLPFSPELQGRTPGRSRNMRRFPSGTCSLKPLILPATTTPTPASPQRQSLSSELQALCYSPMSERELLDEMRTTQEETLAALEGRAAYQTTFHRPMLESEDDSMSQSPSSNRMRSDSHGHSYAEPTTSLFSELEKAEKRGSPRSPSQGRQDYYARSVTNPSTPMGSCRLTVYGSRSNSYNISRIYSPATCPKPNRSFSAPSRGVPSIFHEIKAAFGTIAQALIAGIWQKSIRQLGKLSWWILGILLGPQQRDEWLKGSSLKTQPQPSEWAGLKTLRTASFHSSACRTCGHSSQHAVVSPKKPLNGDNLGHSFSMWTKFSVAIILAFVRAIRQGPASVLEGEGHKEQKHDRHNRSIQEHFFDCGGGEIDDDTASQGSIIWTRPLTAESTN